MKERPGRNAKDAHTQEHTTGTPGRSVPSTCRFPRLRRLKCVKSGEWLENTIERQEAQEEAELRKMDLPAYIPDQLTQNFYAFSLPIAAKAWAWGEALIRNHGAALTA